MNKATTVRGVLALFILHISLGNNAEDTACYPEIRVKRNTVWRISEMSNLKINCTLKYCEEPPTIKWCLLDDPNNCIQLYESPNVKIWQEPVSYEENVVISYLMIKEITMHYSGIYKCQATDNTVGHSIYVSVGGGDNFGNTSDNTNNTSATDDRTSDPDWLPYLYICGGIVALVILVMIISFLSLHGCKRSSCLSHPGEPKGPSQKTEQITQNQGPIRRSSARGNPSPGVPKRDRSLRCHPTQSPVLPKAAAYDNNHLKETHSLHGLLTLPRAPYSQGSPSSQRSGLFNESQGHSRDRRPSQVLYAALDHLAPRDASRTVPKFQPQEEFSEYASIRVT